MPKRVPTFRGASLPAYRPSETTEHRRAAKRFYASRAWRAVRAEKLRRSPLCEDCRVAKRLTEAREVHHKLKRVDRPDLALDLDNLVSLCKSCHSKRTEAGE